MHAFVHRAKWFVVIVFMIVALGVGASYGVGAWAFIHN